MKNFNPLATVIGEPEFISDIVTVAPSENNDAALQAEWLARLEQATLTAPQLHALALPPREPILGGWFCQGDLGFIYAPRGLGKTWLSMSLARAITESVAVGPWPATRARTVLYVDGEMALDGTQERDRTLGPTENERMLYLHHETLFHQTGKVLNLSSLAVQQSLLTLCLKRSVEVVFLDNLSCMFSGMKENDADAWEMVQPWLLELRRHRIAVVLIHHAGRNGAMRGTSRREDAANWIIHLTDPKNTADPKRGARFVSNFEKNRNSTDQDTPPLEWDFCKQDDGTTTLTWKPLDAIQVFRELIHDGLTSCSDLAQEMGISKGQVAKLAKKGFQDGWLTKKGRDYALVS